MFFLAMSVSTESLNQDLKELTPKQFQHLATLFAEFAEEDRDLAQAGMDDYAGMLQQEDDD
jgi:hypothetical protein